MDNLQTNDYNQTVSAKTASYVLVAADKGTRITMSNAGATTITVNTSLFAAGDTLFITNIGAGACTITAGTATVSTASSLVLAQYDSGTLYFTSAGVSIWQKYQGAAASTSGLTKVQASTFAAVANTGTTFDGVFTSTYKKYMVVFNGCTSSGTVAVDIRLRVAGVTIANNYGLSNQTDYTGGSTNVLSNNAASVNVGTWAASIGTNLNLLFTAVGNASERAAFGGIGSSGSAYGVLTVGAVGNTGVVDGFIITPASGTISGTITVYGLAN
jgi:hypothetical protein